VQEAVLNVARHARAQNVLIQAARQEGTVEIEIEDDGRGFDPATAPSDRPHYGLMGIRERAELLGGTASIDTAPGRGTRLEIRVPLTEAASPPPGGVDAPPDASAASPAAAIAPRAEQAPEPSHAAATRLSSVPP
jgi:hypothetical protein